MYRKGKKAEIGIASIILLLIGVVVVAALIPEIASKTHGMTEKIIANDSISISTARPNVGGGINQSTSLNRFAVSQQPTGWKVSKCPITNFVYSNGSTVYTENTDYKISATAGYIYLNNTAAMNTTGTNSTYLQFTYCEDGYVGDEAAGTVTDLILIFAALGLLGFVIFYVLKDANWFSG